MTSPYNIMLFQYHLVSIITLFDIFQIKIYKIMFRFKILFSFTLKGITEKIKLLEKTI